MKRKLSDFFCEANGQYSMARLMSFVSLLMACFQSIYPQIAPNGHFDMAHLITWLSMAAGVKMGSKLMEGKSVDGVNVIPQDASAGITPAPVAAPSAPATPQAGA